MSMSTPASSALRATVAPSPMEWFISSATAPQSETTKPSKPHSLRRIWVSVKGLAVAGIPLMELKELITVAAPASTAAR